MSEPFAGDVEFGKLLAGRSDIDLPRLLLEFAADAYPALDASTCLAELARLARMAKAELAGASDDAVCRLTALGTVLYEQQGFRGNEEEYYDPRNSYLNEVLDRRLGIPITLGIVYMNVARTAGLDVFGVGTPGHFVLGMREGKQTWYVDPFTDGEVLTLDQCRRRVESRRGSVGPLDDSAFRPATPLEIAARVLRNLKAAYAMQNAWPLLLPVQERLAQLLPDFSEERRDLGLVHLRLGDAPRALDLLESYLKHCQPDEVQNLAPYLRAAKRLLAELN